ncbi:hypothetical protein TSOC_012572 [Tetrabaena socialis]|uniref:E3 ubiquitin-protein ligase n=1 Tax=Tetrabaena socialis TaxID=47790 RepID=A0A2J7ZMP6_9CHLO|nr:hypothetical protein TSOC_012572 [Tetrabaena socialis]|eukprot:PNH01536.1 hypothetical protein TSOC_012572 [Tetrabaena socialis]
MVPYLQVDIHLLHASVPLTSSITLITQLQSHNFLGDALPYVNLGQGLTATSIAAGAAHTCAVLDNGALKCWGGNTYGQLGLGDTKSRGGSAADMGDALPSVDLGTGQQATAVTAGFWLTCVVTASSNLKCFGRGGSLGIGDAFDRGGSADDMGDNLPFVSLDGSTSAMLDGSIRLCRHHHHHHHHGPYYHHRLSQLLEQ